VFQAPLQDGDDGGAPGRAGKHLQKNPFVAEQRSPKRSSVHTGGDFSEAAEPLVAVRHEKEFVLGVEAGERPFLHASFRPAKIRTGEEMGEKIFPVPGVAELGFVCDGRVGMPPENIFREETGASRRMAIGLEAREKFGIVHGAGRGSTLEDEAVHLLSQGYAEAFCEFPHFRREILSGRRLYQPFPVPGGDDLDGVAGNS
jgi:hypothetical protein